MHIEVEQHQILRRKRKADCLALTRIEGHSFKSV